jgi:hypothetical protein
MSILRRSGIYWEGVFRNPQLPGSTAAAVGRDHARVHVMLVTERRSTWGARPDELRLAVPRKAPFVLPPPQEATASPNADRVEPRKITSPEQCDQNVIFRSSLKQIGNE